MNSKFISELAIFSSTKGFGKNINNLISFRQMNKIYFSAFNELFTNIMIMCFNELGSSMKDKIFG
jgi:hypothetical protein